MKVNIFAAQEEQYANPIRPKLKGRIFDSADIGCVFNSFWQILLNKCVIIINLRLI